MNRKKSEHGRTNGCRRPTTLTGTTDGTWHKITTLTTALLLFAILANSVSAAACVISITSPTSGTYTTLTITSNGTAGGCSLNNKDVSIKWGDNKWTNCTSISYNGKWGSLSHTYPSAGSYTLTAYLMQQCDQGADKARANTSTSVNFNICTPTTWYQDSDGDGYGNPSVTTQACSAPAGYVSDHTDCDDTQSSVHPGATEVCNGVDDNCNGQIDEGVKNNYYRDSDGDGYGNPLISTQACSVPAGYVADHTDCDDTQSSVHPGATEVCNDVDDNCNGQIDEGVKSTFYRDADSDGYGNPEVTTQACSAPVGYVTDHTDCDDSNVAMNPAATEVCNGIDDNCNGQIDEGVKSTYYKDSDGDTYGNPLVTQQACSQPTGYVSDHTDCDDTKSSVHPGATEVCNGVDDNCNGQIDEDLTAPLSDNQYGVCAGSTKVCEGVDGWANPDYKLITGYEDPETSCDGKDNNCDGIPDEGCDCINGNQTACYDGAQSTLDVVPCHAGTMTCTNGRWGSCVDEVIPQPEVCNGIDDNCDGQPDDGLIAPPADNQYGVCAGSTKVCEGVDGWANPEYGLIAGYEDPETSCDGKDNNCDNITDNGGAELCPASTNDCQVAVCNGQTGCGFSNLLIGTSCGEERSCSDKCVSETNPHREYFDPTSGHDSCDGQGSCIEYQCQQSKTECDLSCGAQCVSSDGCTDTARCTEGKISQTRAASCNGETCSCKYGTWASEACSESVTKCEAECAGNQDCSAKCDEATNSYVTYSCNTNPDVCACQIAETRSCNDQSACTTDSCDPDTGCVNTPITCNDNSVCTDDSCNIETGCVYTPISCDDGDICTADSCNTETGCTHTPIEGCCHSTGDCQTDQVCNAQNQCEQTTTTTTLEGSTTTTTLAEESTTTTTLGEESTTTTTLAEGSTTTTTVEPSTTTTLAEESTTTTTLEVSTTTTTLPLPAGVHIFDPKDGVQYTHIAETVDVTFNASIEGTNGCCTYNFDFGDGTAPLNERSCDLENLTIRHSYYGIGSYLANLSIDQSTCMRPLTGSGASAAPLGTVEPNVMSDSINIFIIKEPYHPTATTVPPTPTTLPPTPTTLPPVPTTLKAPTTTQPPVTVSANVPAVTGAAPATETGKTSPVVEAQPPAAQEEQQPQVIGYAVSPVDYLSLQSSGFRNLLLLLILIAGYAVWARDTQLKNRAEKERKKFKK